MLIGKFLDQCVLFDVPLRKKQSEQYTYNSKLNKQTILG